MMLAIQAVQLGMCDSIRDAATIYNVLWSTLQDHLHNRTLKLEATCKRNLSRERAGHYQVYSITQQSTISTAFGGHARYG